MDERVEELERQVDELKLLVEAMADIALLDTDDETSQKINEILSKFKQN